MYEGADAQGNENVFVLGNGPSRKNINPSELDGKIIGCNACYRDFTPDVICATDAGIISDIIDSGYDGQCYFTHDSWNLLPADVYPSVVNGSEIETIRKAGDNQFVYISGLDSDVKKPQRYIIWVPKEMEHKIKNIGTKVMGWSTGTSALHIACRDFTCNDYEKVYLLGFDHHNNYYDNIYTDTEHYFSKDSKRVNGWKAEYNNWNKQIIKVVEEHPALQFIWINYRGDNFPKLSNLYTNDEKAI